MKFSPLALADITTKDGEHFERAIVCRVSEDSVTISTKAARRTIMFEDIVDSKTGDEVNLDQISEKIESTKQKKSSKKEIAEQLYKEHPEATRKQVIAMLVDVGLTENSASIYHNKIWINGKGTDEK